MGAFVAKSSQCGMKIGVVGGGIAGLAAAWLLAPSHQVVLLEAADALGGHAANVVVEVDGTPLVVTPGATHLLGVGRYPLAHRLLHALGVATEALPASLSVAGEEGALRWTTSLGDARAAGLGPVVMADAAAGWARLLAAGWRLEASGDWGVTWRQFTRALRVPGGFVEEIGEPVVAGFFGVRPSEMGELSARALLAYLVRPLPGPRSWKPGRPVTVRGGTGRLVEALAGELRATCDVRTGVPVESVAAEGGRVVLHHTQGSEVLDAAVVATPPWQAATIVGAPAPERMAALVATPTEIAVHVDQAPWSRGGSRGPVVLAGPDRAQLSTVAGCAGGVQLRRSWVTWGGPEPAGVLWRGRFRHVAPSPALFDLQRSVAAWQGTDRRWLAGSWTIDVDSLESALHSALLAAEGIDRAAPRVRWLRCGITPTTKGA